MTLNAIINFLLPFILIAVMACVCALLDVLGSLDVQFDSSFELPDVSPRDLQFAVEGKDAYVLSICAEKLYELCFRIDRFEQLYEQLKGLKKSNIVFCVLSFMYFTWELAHRRMFSQLEGTTHMAACIITVTVFVLMFIAFRLLMRNGHFQLGLDSYSFRYVEHIRYSKSANQKPVDSTMLQFEFWIDRESERISEVLEKRCRIIQAQIKSYYMCKPIIDFVSIPAIIILVSNATSLFT